MRHDFSGFDRDMNRHKRLAKRGFAAVIIIRLLIFGLIIFGGVKLFQYLDANDTSLLKEGGKMIQHGIDEVNEGREAVKDTAVYNDTTLNVK
jgi:hypothetical protein